MEPPVASAAGGFPSRQRHDRSVRSRPVHEDERRGQRPFRRGVLVCATVSAGNNLGR